MAVLNRVRAASLLETLTASLLIVIVFMIASLSINSLFRNTIRTDEHLLQNRLRELRYFGGKGKLAFPFHEEREYWTITGQESKGKYRLQIFNKRQNKEYHLEINPE